jgi:hypothetical protein
MGEVYSIASGPHGDVEDTAGWEQMPISDEKAGRRLAVMHMFTAHSDIKLASALGSLQLTTLRLPEKETESAKLTEIMLKYIYHYVRF